MTLSDVACDRHGLSLGKVRSWCLQNGWSGRQFLALYRQAYLICLSRLIQSIHIERICDTALSLDADGERILRLGTADVLEVPLEASLLPTHIDITGVPYWHRGLEATAIRSSGRLLRALRSILADRLSAEAIEALSSDFQNSFANMILNLALGSRLDRHSQAIEPVYRGHSYYPFPALRIGPSVADVVGASHLSPRAVALPLLEAGNCRFHSIEYDDPSQCSQDWSGLTYAGNGAVLPLHPWQLRLSPVVQDLLRRGAITRLPASVAAMPLASQRTCRVIETGYDLKLPVNVTITGEHRLLYRLNSHNAPFVSALIREVHRMRCVDDIDFQYDVASLCWDEPDAGLHLSAIIRAPCPQADGECVVPALNLWSNPAQAGAWLALGERRQVVDTFQHYCFALMRGPLLLCAEWGLAFEPHLQNVYVVVRDKLPVRIILRDLDNTIMDQGRIAALCRNYRLPLAADTWSHMPSAFTGQARLLHAMFHGHLREVMYFLLKHTEVDLASLQGCIEEAWRAIGASAGTDASKRNLDQLRQRVGEVKSNLRMRLERSTTMRFERQATGHRPAGTNSEGM
jgi:hypothetical protein